MLISENIPLTLFGHEKSTSKNIDVTKISTEGGLIDSGKMSDMKNLYIKFLDFSADQKISTKQFLLPFSLQ